MRLLSGHNNHLTGAAVTNLGDVPFVTSWRAVSQNAFWNVEQAKEVKVNTLLLWTLVKWIMQNMICWRQPVLNQHAAASNAQNQHEQNCRLLMCSCPVRTAGAWISSASWQYGLRNVQKKPQLSHQRQTHDADSFYCGCHPVNPWSQPFLLHILIEDDHKDRWQIYRVSAVSEQTPHRTAVYKNRWCRAQRAWGTGREEHTACCVRHCVYVRLLSLSAICTNETYWETLVMCLFLLSSCPSPYLICYLKKREWT